MRKKTSKIVYAILGVLMILFFALAVFAVVVRRQDFLAEGDLLMAEFSIQLGIFAGICGIILLGVIFLLLWKDKKAKLEQDLFNQEMKSTPLFERWFRSEEDFLKNQQRSSVIAVRFLSIFLFLSLIGMLILLMDGGGISEAAGCLFLLFVIYLSWWRTDYRKQFIRPLLNSVSKQLLTPADKEAFARQLLESGSDVILYTAQPQAFKSVAFITDDYSYIRQFRKCRIIKNEEISRAILKKGSYTVGLHPHFRNCFAIELYGNNNPVPIWCGYFHRQEELYYALGILKKRSRLSDENVNNLLEK